MQARRTPSRAVAVDRALRASRARPVRACSTSRRAAAGTRATSRRAARGCSRSTATPPRSPTLADVRRRRDARPRSRDGRRGRSPGERFDAIVVVNYLHRPLFAHLRAALAPDGVLLYETFATGNEAYGRPANPDFLLRRDELLSLAAAPPDPLTVVAFEQGRTGDGARRAVVQRLAAVGRGARMAAAAGRVTGRSGTMRTGAVEAVGRPRGNGVKCSIWLKCLHADRKPRRHRDADAGGRCARPAGAAQAHRFPRRERHGRHRHRRHDRRIADGRRRRALPAHQDGGRARGGPRAGGGRHRRQLDGRGDRARRVRREGRRAGAPVGRPVLQQADAGRAVPPFPHDRRDGRRCR